MHPAAHILHHHAGVQRFVFQDTASNLVISKVYILNFIRCCQRYAFIAFLSYASSVYDIYLYLSSMYCRIFIDIYLVLLFHFVLFYALLFFLLFIIFYSFFSVITSFVIHFCSIFLWLHARFILYVIVTFTYFDNFPTIVVYFHIIIRLHKHFNGCSDGTNVVFKLSNHW